ncbi:hypothetical protein ACFLYL_04795 [Chloroflexota bacterium]
MTDGQNETILMVRADNTAIRNETSQVSAIQRAEAGATDYVPHVCTDQVKLMAVGAGHNNRNGERNVLLNIFDAYAAFRVLCKVWHEVRQIFVCRCLQLSVGSWQAIYAFNFSANKLFLHMAIDRGNYMAKAMVIDREA